VRTPSHGLICASSTARNEPGLCRPRQRRLVDDRRQAAEAELHDAADEVGAGSQTAVAESAPGLELAARNHAADLLVSGSSRRGRVGQILAGVALGLLPGAPCSVALPPPGYAREPRRLGLIGAAHDGSAESREALEVAAGWPRSAMRGPNRGGRELPASGRAHGPITDRHPARVEELEEIVRTAVQTVPETVRASGAVVRGDAQRAGRAGRASTRSCSGSRRHAPGVLLDPVSSQPVLAAPSPCS
jgi:hypothetical protein